MGLKSLAISWFEAVAGAFTKLDQRLREAGKSIGETIRGIDLKAAGQSIVGTLSDGLMSAWSTTLATVSGWGAGIQNAFSGIDLYADGARIINGLLDGLTSAWNSVVSTVRGWADQLRGLLNFNTGGPRVSLPSLPSPSPVTSAPATSGGLAHSACQCPARRPAAAVRRGLTYQINERGRETVTMGTNGYVTPANRLGGGDVNVTIHVNGAGSPSRSPWRSAAN